MDSLRTISLGLALIALACGDEDTNEETATGALLSVEPTILVDLDPSSTGMTFTLESITASADGTLFLSDRESGNVYSVDPATAAPVVVGKLDDRTDSATGMPLRANGAGLVFTPAGDLLIASGSFNEVLRLTAAELRAGNASAQTHITGVRGANSVLLVGANLYVTGGATGNIYVAPASGGAAETWANIEPTTRAVPPDSFMQSVVANGITRAPDGDLLVADTARAAIWRFPVNADGSAGSAEQWAQDPQLEGVDGLTYDPQGRLWAAVNEHNALVVVDEDGAIRQVHQNANTGPLEFPAALVFVGDTGYVANFDRARALNFAPDGTTSSAGIGASIAEFRIVP